MSDYTITKEDVVRVLSRISGPGPQATAILLKRLDDMFADLPNVRGAFSFADVRKVLLSAEGFNVSKDELIQLSNIENAHKRGEDVPQDGVSRAVFL